YSLDSRVSVNVRTGSGEAEITLEPLAYVKAVLNSDMSDKAKDAVCALYQYSADAKAYRASH
ncbi:MAG: hypothetical protein IKD69_14145, partial [Solobacterium sp.]|nr:hypothetical protein [Solobacterium sp.]